jgi:hypothetical protein
MTKHGKRTKDGSHALGLHNEIGRGMQKGRREVTGNEKGRDRRVTRQRVRAGPSLGAGCDEQVGSEKERASAITQVSRPGRRAVWLFGGPDCRSQLREADKSRAEMLLASEASGH